MIFDYVNFLISCLIYTLFCFGWEIQKNKICTLCFVNVCALVCCNTILRFFLVKTFDFLCYKRTLLWPYCFAVRTHNSNYSFPYIQKFQTNYSYLAIKDGISSDMLLSSNYFRTDSEILSARYGTISCKHFKMKVNCNCCKRNNL